jgi:hypothetical protein
LFRGRLFIRHSCYGLLEIHIWNVHRGKHDKCGRACSCSEQHQLQEIFIISNPAQMIAFPVWSEEIQFAHLVDALQKRLMLLLF